MARPVLFSLILLVLTAGTAAAHGGAYRGPLGEIPPGPVDPREPKPPVRPSPGPLPPQKAAGRFSQPPMSLDHWIFWWAYNKDALLPEPSGRTAVSEEAVRKRIEPALIRTVGNKEIHPDIRAGAVLALARVPGAARHLSLLLEIAAGDGQDRIVVESAILALGFLPDRRDEVRGPLLRFVGDRAAPMRQRCFAVVALGLLRDDSDRTFAALAARLDGSEPHPDVRISALYAIGLVGDRRRVGNLAEWFSAGAVGEAPLSALGRSWIHTALGKIGDPSGWNAISRGLRDDAPVVRRAAADGAGRVLPALPPAAQGPALRVLIAYWDGERDGLAQNLALVSIGRVAGTARATPAVRVRAREHIRAVFRAGDREEVRPYAALSLALAGDAALADDIRPVLAKLRGDKVALGAQALALGLLRDRKEPTISVLKSILVDRGQVRKLRGAAAVALGLLGGEEAQMAILGAIGERENRPLGIDLATAAGLLGDPAGVPHLLALIENRRVSQFTLGAAAVAIGRIGGEDALGKLLKILEPEAWNGVYPDLTRALVTIALGRLAAPDGRDPLDRLSDGFPWRASVSALDEILTIR